MKWLKAIVLVVGVLAAVAALVTVFVSLDDYIPEVEKELTARVGEPVSIEHLHVALLPIPHARLDGVTIGTAEDMRVAKVTLRPDLWSLLGSPKVIRGIELDDVVLTQKALGTLTALSQGDKGAGVFRVQNVRLGNAVVKLERSQFGPFDLRVRVADATQRGLVMLKTHDGALDATLAPETEHFRIEISARKWTLPMGPAFVFDQLDAKGIVRHNDAELSSIAAKLYGGSASGAVTIAWDKGIAVKGALDLRGIELQQPVAVLSPATRMSGRLNAKPAFSAHAQSADQLDDVLRIESAFAIDHGALYGFDIATAIATSGRQTRGGDTRFDEFSGKLSLDRRSYRFTDLRIAWAGVVTRGSVSISPSRALSGDLSVKADALGRTLTIPLSLTGTLDSPMLLSNGSPSANLTANASR